MLKTRTRFGAPALALLFLSSASLRAADALFTAPLHLTRRIEDSALRRTITLEEYCDGDRIVTVAGPRTTIVDYRQKELTEIDRSAATYSVTRFEEIAAMDTSRGVAAATTDVRELRVTPGGSRRSAANRSVDAFEIRYTRGGQLRRLEVAVDRQVALSAAASEALIGAAYPRQRNAEHDAVLSVAAPQHAAEATTSAAKPRSYGLVAEQTTTYNAEGIEVVVRNAIVSIDSATIPPDLLLIPAGATRVESRLIRTPKEIRQLDHPSANLNP